jgi:hypothetical protein
MEIMSKIMEYVPEDISRQYLELQKEIIMPDIRKQVEERRKLAAQKSKGINPLTSSSIHQEQASSENTPQEGSEDKSSETKENDAVNEEEIDPTLEDVA